ncbi:hypothetical protein BS78_03G077800 [Paspalum vaginatum]|nr:hypothetical protein BS78_03G077800 [Paspalum vaginatum]
MNATGRSIRGASRHVPTYQARRGTQSYSRSNTNRSYTYTSRLFRLDFALPRRSTHMSRHVIRPAAVPLEYIRTWFSPALHAGSACLPAPRSKGDHTRRRGLLCLFEFEIAVAVVGRSDRSVTDTRHGWGTTVRPPPRCTTGFLGTRARFVHTGSISLSTLACSVLFLAAACTVAFPATAFCPPGIQRAGG